MKFEIRVFGRCFLFSGGLDVLKRFTRRHDQLFPLSNPAILPNLIWRFLASLGECQFYQISATTDPYYLLRQE